jgi:hypothetical protein
MADYYPLIARAVGGLDKNTGDARRALYERARTALVTQLRGVEPALSESEITRERLALEEAIRKVEAESARRSRADTPRAAAKPAAGEEQAPRAAPTLPRTETLPRAGPLPRGDAPFDTKPGEPMFPEPSSSEAPLQPDEPRKSGRGRWFGIPSLTGDAAKAGAEGAAEPAAEAPAAKPQREGRAPFRFDERQHDPAGMRDPLFEPRSTRPRPHLAGDADEEVEDDTPPRSYAGLGKLAAVLLVIAALGGLLYWQSDNIGGLYQAMVGPSQPTEQARETTTPTRPKIPDRIGSEPQRPGQAVAPVAQRVVLYEEDPADPQGKRYVGSAIWRTEQVSPGPGLAPELAVRADVEVPERRITMTWSIRRNTDTNLPASHTVEITFNLPADFPGGGIDKVPGILMKQAEQTRGTPLAGQAVKVTTGFFLIGLSAVEADVTRNVQLLKERSWFDVPVVYNNGRRAILAMEKGTPGERAFEQAFAAWTRATTR